MSSGPLSAVLAAIEAGARLRTDIAQRTSLSPDVIDAALEQLTRMGRLTANPLTSACPDGGCLGCAAPSGDGCATPSGPVLVALTARR